MDRRDTVAFTGHGSQQILGAFEPHAAARQACEGVSTGHQQIKRGPVGGGVSPRAPSTRSSLNTTTSGENPGAPLPTPRVPATTTAPAGRASAIACANAAGALAVTSTTTSASPPVCSVRAATGSSIATSTARSAPNCAASANRSASRGPNPVTITNPAPAPFAAAAAHSPRIPGPSTATTSPGLVSGIVTPQRIPAPSGLNKVATSGLRSPATRNTIESGARY